MINKVKSAIAASRRRKREKRQAELRRKLKFPEQFATFASAQSYVPRFKYSVVTAAYGVEAYIDDFFSSLMQQTVGFRESIEVIVVDDGSKDDTLVKARDWERRYPDNIKVITQKNSGPAEARNAGLKYVQHDWVTFTDPDDMLSQDYFESVDVGICRNLNSGLQVDMVACNVLMYNDADYKIRADHPLNRSFVRGERLVSYASDLHDDLKLQAASCVFRTEIVKSKDVAFPDVRPSFEDAMFVAFYLISSGTGNTLFSPSSRYFYRKRSSSDSIIDTAWSTKGKYIDQLRDGNLKLIDYSMSSLGCVPVWVQRKVFYDLAWHLKMFFNNHKNWSLVPEDIRLEYFDLLNKVLSYIDERVISDFELANVPVHLKLGVLNRYKSISYNDQSVRVFKVDFSKRELCIGFYHTKPEVDLEFRLGGDFVAPVSRKTRVFEYFNEPMVYETLAWIHWRGDGELSCFSENVSVPVKLKGVDRSSIGWLEVENCHRPKKIGNSRLPLEKRVIRTLSNFGVFQRRYSNSWLLMDRDTQADDNAEHLYRYLRINHPEVNAWFVLRRSSHDWERLKKDGFRLLEYGSVSHKLAMINADHVISSHVDQYLFNVLPEKYYSDVLGYKFTFLQHGVTHNDLSDWLNSKNISCLVASAIPEYKSLVDSGSYKFTGKEVALTGFPRHDRLFYLNSRREKMAKRKVVVMPTWRQSLTGKSIGASNSRAYYEGFAQSEFYKGWQSLISDSRIHKISRLNGIELVFFPHANLHPYLKDFDFDGFTVATHRESKSIQDYIVEADLLITDYSSVAFEAAFLGRSIAYYQFDRDFVFGGGHLTKKGYFSYEKHGFGPVALTVDELVSIIEDAVERDFAPRQEYSTRMGDFFAYRDAGNCERVYERIKALDSPEPSIIDAIATR